MQWNDAVITNAGVELLAQVASGGTLTINSAGLGGGTVDTAALMAQTHLKNPLTVAVQIAEKIALENGISIRLQIKNTGVALSQRMKQVGLFAKIGAGDTVLFAIIQDNYGEEIPSAEEYPDFLLEFTVALAISNTDNIKVTIDTSVFVTKEQLDSGLAEKAEKKHTHTVNDINNFPGTATSLAAGLMSSADKSKLDGIEKGANKYTHPSYTARTGVPTANQSPAFGGTFSVTQPVSDASGHITEMTSRNIIMPSSTATNLAAGLMSSTDKSKLDQIQMSIYRGISDLGVSNDDTADAIWKAIPEDSMFAIEAQTLTDASWNFPIDITLYSLLVIKLSNLRPLGIYLYPKISGNIYYAYVDSNGTFIGNWQVVGEGCNARTLNGRHSGRIATRKADGNYWNATAENQNDAFIQWDGKKFFVLKTVGGNLTMVDNAATLDGHPATDFVLKSDYDALVARVAALESK